MVVSTGQQSLIEVGAVESAEPVAGGAAEGKVFRGCDRAQVLLLPPSLDDWLPAEHLARFVDELVESYLDVSAFYAAHTSLRGAPPFDPRMMLKVLLYGYVSGVRSSRRIERACTEDVAFRWLAANTVPDYRSVARFRQRHLSALEALFGQVLALCQAAGMVKLGQVALDGTKVRANASRHKAMSYERMGRSEAELAAEVEAMLAEAEAIDAAEDAEFGADRRGDELPAELASRETRLEAIRAAKQALEEQARERAADQAAGKVHARAARQADRGEPVDDQQVDTDAAAAAEQAAREAVPDPKAQRNFTDPDSRIMKTDDGSFQQCYNAQIVADSKAQVIVAADLIQAGTDVTALSDMLEQTIANTATTPRRLLADAGYYSKANTDACADAGVDALIATGRLKHSEQIPDAPRGRIPADATPKQRMARKLRTKKGRAAYARRKTVVEPVFGQMQTRQDADRLLLRGHQAARAEHRLLCAGHNLLKLFTTGKLERLRELLDRTPTTVTPAPT